MVVDSSALLAIFLKEPEREHFLKLLLQERKRLLSAATLVETGIIVETRRGEAAARDLDLFLFESEVEVVAVDRTQAEQARAAYRRFGKGRHPAALNFGDCFTYALSIVSGEPVLAKGEEFKRANLTTL
jgi:ribonuclease VapC